MRSWRNIAFHSLTYIGEQTAQAGFACLRHLPGWTSLSKKDGDMPDLTDAPRLRATVTFPLKRCGATFQSELRAIASQILAALLPCR